MRKKGGFGIPHRPLSRVALHLAAKRVCALLLVVPALAAGLAGAYDTGCPPSGMDTFDSAAKIQLDLSSIGGPVLDADLAGPARVVRRDPFDPGDGRQVIPIELVSLELRGTTPFGPLVVRESSARESFGKIRQLNHGVDFPAQSFFDIFVEVDLPNFPPLVTPQPDRLETVIHEVPPVQSEYKPTVTTPVPIYTRTGKKVGTFKVLRFSVGERPSFSVAAQGTSGFDGADILGIPASPAITAANLGLAAQDDITGLSYGIDHIAKNTDVRFSVDPTSQGLPGTAVATQAAAGEAEGDEFSVRPLLPVGGSNAIVLDENGSSAPSFGLAVGDDVDAPTEPPPSMADSDGDGVPDVPVYLSLKTASPTLTTIGAGPADIL